MEKSKYYINEGQGKWLEYQAGGRDGTYAVVGAMDGTCSKDERR
jgi:hypothetical protein